MNILRHLYQFFRAHPGEQIVPRKLLEQAMHSRGQSPFERAGLRQNALAWLSVVR